MKFNKYGIATQTKPKSLLPSTRHHILLDELHMHPQWHNARDLQQLFNNGNDTQLINQLHHNQGIIRDINRTQKARFNMVKAGLNMTLPAQTTIIGSRGNGKTMMTEAMIEQLRFSKLNNKFRKQ